jgi:APA family basic amino acid/polyamine antiporter
VSAFYFEKKNFEPFLDKKSGVNGIFAAAQSLYFCYCGFDFVTTISEESSNPKRDIPRAVKISMYSVIVIYTLVCASIYGVGNLYSKIDSSNGGTTAVIDVYLNREDVNLSWMAYIILFCSILGMSASVFTSLLGQTRLMVQFARDGLLFSVF